MSTPRLSSILILHRNGPAGLEVFLGERSAKLQHWPGHWVFPGGCVDPGDEDIPLSECEKLDSFERRLVACAARELFEETGLLVVKPEPSPGLSPDLELARQEILAAEKPARAFREVLERTGLTVDASAFHRVTRLVTPRFSGQRFDASFYLVRAAGEPSIIDGELVRGRWLAPGEALRLWRRGELRLVAPTLEVLDQLAAHGLEGALAHLQLLPADFEGSGRSVRVAPGYELVPLETPPLPPEIPTNSILVGERKFIWVDPAPRLEREQDHLAKVIAARRDRGHELLAIVLTHHHPDHVGMLERARELTRAPLWAHRITGELLETPLDRALEDGARIELGESPAGTPGWALEALFTPGHAEGHLALHDALHRTLVAGDLVSTLVSMYVGSPGGNLRQYLASLERVRELDLDALFPAHGAPSRSPRKLLEDTLRHRRARLEEVHAALGDEPRDPWSIACAVYPDGGGKLRPLTERTMRAALEYLVEDGRAERVGEDTFRRTPTGAH